MLTMNKANTHAIVSFVASGHVLFMNAHTRQPITCIRTSVGSTGVRQVHQSFPSPDETHVAVANQNGKRPTSEHRAAFTVRARRSWTTTVAARRSSRS